VSLAQGLGYQSVKVKCYDILETRMANAMITPIYVKSVHMIIVKGNAASSQGGSLSRTLCGLNCATTSLFGKAYRLSLRCFGRTVAHGLSGSVLRYGWDQVVGGGRMLSSMLILRLVYAFMRMRLSGAGAGAGAYRRER
jgi:hypothetical protein